MWTWFRKTVATIKTLWWLSENWRHIQTANKLAVDDLHHKLSWFEQRLNEHTVVHADIHYQHPYYHQVIVVGKYRGKDYVRCFNLSTGSFDFLIDQLKHEEAFAQVGRFDTPHNMEFSAVYPHNRF